MLMVGTGFFVHDGFSMPHVLDAIFFFAGFSRTISLLTQPCPSGRGMLFFSRFGERESVFYRSSREEILLAQGLPLMPGRALTFAEGRK
ncbi:hypothetical protein [Faecalispora anaeroviscerum]|uniref:hypothetical protein n=1 Tax=Faecalispora anaeroviscerum TaxID=2991836 RepID=UPI0024BAC848|nr:hypothetical protein [Faecalispora anaeroviscerum]